MDKILFTKQYRMSTLFFIVLSMLILADMIYGFIHPQHSVLLCFSAIFIVIELYKIKKFFTHTIYQTIFYFINIISVSGAIYFYYHNYTEHYNTFMFAMLGIFNTLFYFNKTLQNENTEQIVKS